MVSQASSLLPDHLQQTCSMSIPQEIHDAECDKAELMYEALAVQSVALGVTQYAMVLLVGTLIDDMVCRSKK